MNNTNLWEYDEQNEEVFAPNEYPFRNYIISFVALGAYADINVMPKLNVYTDLKFPIGFWDDFEVGFFEVFFYDIILGATYEIAPNISLGIEGNISNANYGGLEIALYEKYDKENNKDNTENKYFNFTIGAKVGYSF